MPTEILKRYFGYSSFRPLQEEVIAAVLSGRDCLVIMPTGGGKSLCYQIPAIKLTGTALVVSPLISLMKNQVDGLRAAGVRAAYLNSSLALQEQAQVEQDFEEGKLDLLYVSPEKITATPMRHRLLQLRKMINLVAIDEAHCISSWGHDFRPEYNMLQFLKSEMPEVPVIALTATADRVTRKDIIEQLHLKAPEIFLASFDRPNIYLEKRPGNKRREQILRFVKERPDTSGIIYCLSRKSTERLASNLREAGYRAECYHAGMSSQGRSDVQERFIKDELPIIVATIAFGMGIDKSNVRWVIHYNLPKNVESYYQEIGRAGRDGLPTEALLFYSYSDVMLWQDIIKNEESELQDIKLGKLRRIQQYAEAITCRRRILLSYFNEDIPTDCGNCDICKHPPERFDGTLIAQKALSAVYRLKEKAGMGALIDVLRGSMKQEVLQHRWHLIKTYGTGKDISYRDWQNYLLQLLHLGYIEVAIERKNTVCLTPGSHRVLFENERVQLVKMQTQVSRKEKEIAKAKSTKVHSNRQRVRDELFEHLRALRRKIALEKGVPPYIVFSDATLEEMAAASPKDEAELYKISGVGEQKLNTYGPKFLEAIRNFQKPQKPKKSNTLSDTRTITAQLFNEGLSPQEIATKRELHLSTIFTHLTQSIIRGDIISHASLVSPATIDLIQNAINKIPEYDGKLKPIFEYLKETISYDEIRIALAILEQRGASN